MGKSRFIPILIVICVTATAGFFIEWHSRPPDPIFDSRRTSDWVRLALFDKNKSIRSTARDVICEKIGNPATPFIVEHLKAMHRGAFRWWLSDHQTHFPQWIRDRINLHFEHYDGFDEVLWLIEERPDFADDLFPVVHETRSAARVGLSVCYRFFDTVYSQGDKAPSLAPLLYADWENGIWPVETAIVIYHATGDLNPFLSELKKSFTSPDIEQDIEFRITRVIGYTEGLSATLAFLIPETKGETSRSVVAQRYLEKIAELDHFTGHAKENIRELLKTSTDTATRLRYQIALDWLDQQSPISKRTDRSF